MEEQPQRQRPEGMDDDTWALAQVMGFARFKSTKNTKVPGNDKNYGVRREKKMEARQYMNRQGGFNRPLSPSHAA
jgi:U4/U6.U5 tri-snRNP-associated protein 3